MMKKLNVLIAALVTSGLVGVALAAHAADAGRDCDSAMQGQHHGMDGEHDYHGEQGDMRHKHMERNRPPFEGILDLTDAQKKTLADARTKQEPAMKDLHEKMRAAHEALDKADDSNADDATLTKLSSNLASLIAQQEVARIKAHRQLLSVLTAEQKKKLDAFEAEHKASPRWKDMHQDSSNAK
jgi:Spy/CpxP family protein refolding chaperone